MEGVVTMLNKAQAIKNKILGLTKSYYNEVHNIKKPFKPGDLIHYAGRVFDEREIQNLISASLDFWLTSGPYTKEFESKFCQIIDVKHCSLVNSGSSANLLAFMSLTSPLLGKRRIKRGDEVITIACGFPTTISPILQYGAVPVFVDVEIPSYNIDCSQLEKALSRKTKAIMIAHTMGNPFNVKLIKDFCTKHNLWLCEDNCDSLGSKYALGDKALPYRYWKYTGTFGDIGTSSFYPPHHITGGEAGAVYTNDPLLHKIINSLRDWGRDCSCPSGKDNICGHRFSKKFGELPYGYDHKYVYSHLGYNLKATDLQASILCIQLAKLRKFIEARKDNWNELYRGLVQFNDVFILPRYDEPTAYPSWFGFLLTLKKSGKFKREDILNHLEAQGIQTRVLFAGNLTKHPCFDHIRNTKAYRVIGDLRNTNKIMNDTFWIGVYPGLTKVQIKYIIDTFKDFLGR